MSARRGQLDIWTDPAQGREGRETGSENIVLYSIHDTAFQAPCECEGGLETLRLARPPICHYLCYASQRTISDCATIIVTTCALSCLALPPWTTRGGGSEEWACDVVGFPTIWVCIRRIDIRGVRVLLRLWGISGRVASAPARPAAVHVSSPLARAPPLNKSNQLINSDSMGPVWLGMVDAIRGGELPPGKMVWVM